MYVQNNIPGFTQAHAQEVNERKNDDHVNIVEFIGCIRRTDYRTDFDEPFVTYSLLLGLVTHYYES